MAQPTEKEITNRAYKIWERNGKPEGRRRILASGRARAAQRGQILAPANARHAVTDKNCPICFGMRWVCEDHPDRV
jgi:hypothetical protein